MKTVIIGAGLTGLSAAYHLKKNWIILEKEPKVGGLASSDRVQGFTFDKTGHLMHMHHPYTKDWLIDKLLAGKLTVHQRNSWIFSKNVFTRYPFQANTYGLPDKILTECVTSFLEARDRFPRASLDPSFERWCLETFGTGISKHFMFAYNRKLWLTTLKCMTTEWLRNFVPVPSREEVLYGALTDQKKFFGYNASFYYPKSGGIQTLPDAIKGELEEGSIYLNCEAREIDLAAKKIHTPKGSFSYDWLINTGPLHWFLKTLGKQLPQPLRRASVKSMTYTVVYNLNLGITHPQPTDKHWVYFPENRYPFYRIGVSSNFTPALCPPGHSSFYVEFARKPDEPFSYEAMLASTIKHIKNLGWMRPKDEVSAVQWNRIEPAYVIFTKERREFIPEVMRFLESHSILSTGRYGAWKYSFMEEAILDGKAAAEKILQKAGLTL